MGGKATTVTKLEPVRRRSGVRASVQPKLTVGPTSDRFEREANQTADRVVQGGPLPVAAPPPVLSSVTAQRAAAPVPAGPEQTEEEKAPPEAVQRSTRATGPEGTPAPPAVEEEVLPSVDEQLATAQRSESPAPTSETVSPAGGAAPESVEQTIQQMRGAPAPGIDPATRGFMEERMGTDLGGVRVHTGRAADEASQELSARAFTVGQDVFFANGQYNPQTSGGKRLIAHELAHTVQQGGGSTQARRIQRAGDAASASTVKSDENEEPKKAKTKKLEDDDWAIDISAGGDGGTITVPKLELPEVAGTLKGTAGGDISPASSTGVLPKKGEKFVRPPVSKRATRESEAAFQKWIAHVRDNYSADLQTKLTAQLQAQADAAPISDDSDTKAYVLKQATVKATTSEFLLIGTTSDLARHDSLVRPMLKHSGAKFDVDADHILEDQIGGMDSAENLWLLDRSYNRSIGPQIDSRINDSLSETVKKAKKYQEKNDVQLDGKLEENQQVYRRKWTIVFKTVGGGKFSGSPKTYWTKKMIREGAHLKHFKALTEKELFEQGLKFDKTKKVKPTHINVFPAKDGGRPIGFKVAKDGKSLRKPGFFYTGIEVLEITSFEMPTAENQGGVITELKVRYKKKSKKQKDVIKKAEGTISVRHDPLLGFGGYVSRDSITSTFGEADFSPLSRISFPDVHISSDGELVATGNILSSKALLPGLQIPITLRGSDIFVSFPVPTEKLNFGPVQVTDAAIDLGVGDQGFFMQGSAGIAVEKVGSGSLSARVERDDVILKGDFNLELDFLDPAKIAVKYSLAKDDFEAKATLGVKDGILPGVESGEVTIEISRQSFGLVGSLQLGGALAGSTVTVGYTPEQGLLIEGRDLPLPVDKLPGVSDAKATVKAVRNPQTGVWTISGGGKATLSAPGATGTLDILVDGEAISFAGRADVAKGPASGFLEVKATNRALDDSGEPIEGAPVGEFTIWGAGEASITFGKILTGMAGIEYTPDGRVIITGEIALPPTFDLFERKEYKKSLLEISTPDFPIWGVKVGPVGIGIFAFADASVFFSAYVGPGQLRDTKVSATLDIDKPAEAVIEGHAQFYVPAYAGLTLDVGGGLKAQLANVYAKGRIGLDGTLGILAEGTFDVDISWNSADGLEVGAQADIIARPKFEVGVNASVTVGVDLLFFDIEKTWGPWRKKLGEFGPDMELGVMFPVKWSEKEGLDLSLDNITVKKPTLDAKAIIGSAFDTLV